VKRRLANLALVVAVLCGVTVLAVRVLFPEASYEGRTVGAWVTALESRDTEEHAAAVRALNALGPEAVPYLTGELKALGNSFPRARRWLSRISPEPVKRVVRRLRGNSGPQKQAAALKALLQMGTNGTAAIPVVASTLEGSDHYLSSLAGRTLAAQGPEALPSLMAALDNPDFGVRSYACTALGALGTNAAPAVPKLANILTNEVGAISRIVGFTLAQIGKPAIPALLPIVLHTNETAARWAAYALGLIGPDAKAAVPGMLEALPDRRRPEWREAALIAMGRMGLPDSEAAELVAASITDPDPVIRAAAAQALAERPKHVRERVSKFVDLLSDPEAKVREQAALALSRVGRAGEPALSKLEALQASDSSEVRRAASGAVANIRSTLENVPPAPR
jgi:HEAT repeat protein